MWDSALIGGVGKDSFIIARPGNGHAAAEAVKQSPTSLLSLMPSMLCAVGKWPSLIVLQLRQPRTRLVA
jgi:hypothetical protein